jgi:hypothetical protein
VSAATARRLPDRRAATARRRYFVLPLLLGLEVEPLELGMELEPLGLEVELELESDVEGLLLVDGAVLDGGDADGVVPLGVRSPVRSVRDSLQAVSRPRLSATAKTAVSILFISMPPPCGVAQPHPQGATAVPPPAA